MNHFKRAPKIFLLVLVFALLVSFFINNEWFKSSETTDRYSIVSGVVTQNISQEEQEFVHEIYSAIDSLDNHPQKGDGMEGYLAFYEKYKNTDDKELSLIIKILHLKYLFSVENFEEALKLTNIFPDNYQFPVTLTYRNSIIGLTERLTNDKSITASGLRHYLQDIINFESRLNETKEFKDLLNLSVPLEKWTYDYAYICGDPTVDWPKFYKNFERKRDLKIVKEFLNQNVEGVENLLLFNSIRERLLYHGVISENDAGYQPMDKNDPEDKFVIDEILKNTLSINKDLDLNVIEDNTRTTGSVVKNHFTFSKKYNFLDFWHDEDDLMKISDVGSWTDEQKEKFLKGKIFSGDVKQILKKELNRFLWINKNFVAVSLPGDFRPVEVRGYSYIPMYLIYEKKEGHWQLIFLLKEMQYYGSDGGC